MVFESSPFEVGHAESFYRRKWSTWFLYFFSLAAAILGFLKPERRRGMTMIIISIGIIYNAVFIEEFIWGKINGSSATVLKESVLFIKNSPEIKSIITYNDNGAYALWQIDKY